MKQLLIAAAMAVAAVGASASTIDFESVPLGPIAGDAVTLSADGFDVSFSGPGLQIRDFSSLGVGNALSTFQDAGPITVTFAPGVTSDFVAFSNPLHDGGNEIDHPIGTAYDINGNVLATVMSSSATHLITAPGIAKVVYMEGNPGEGFVMGDFQFHAMAVPEPETYALLLAGLAVVGGIARRRARAG